MYATTTNLSTGHTPFTQSVRNLRSLEGNNAEGQDRNSYIALTELHFSLLPTADHLLNLN
jgi:hypothetical protein